VAQRSGRYWGTSGHCVDTANWSLLTDTVEKGKNEPTKIFACTPIEIGFS
jgi:hypothetical protein